MKPKPTIWYVVADGGHARILAHDDTGFSPVSALASSDAHHDSSDLGSDRPGRSVESIGAAHHAIEPRSDPQQRAKLDFAHSVANILNEEATRGRFAQLVLVAPAKTLHAIKADLNGAAAGKLIAEHQGDFVKLPEDDLRARLISLTPHHL